MIGPPVGQAAELVGWVVVFTASWVRRGSGVVLELDPLDRRRVMIDHGAGVASVSWLDCRPVRRVECSARDSGR